jgi:hypothetical protein
MNKNTIQLAKKSTVLVLGLFMQINFAHSQVSNVTTERSSTCTGSNRIVEGSHFILPTFSSPPTQKPGASFISNECQTDNIAVKIGDVVNVKVRTLLPNTKLTVYTTTNSNGTTKFMTSEYSKPGIYNFKLPVKADITNGLDNLKFSAGGKAVNNQKDIDSITTPLVSVTIAKTSTPIVLPAGPTTAVKPF